MKDNNEVKIDSPDEKQMADEHTNRRSIKTGLMKAALIKIKKNAFKLFRRFTKEIIIALILAIAAAVGLEAYYEYAKTTMLKRNTRGTATLIVYNSKGEQIGTATGVFISADGKLVTNYHVFNKASKIEARLASGAYYRWQSLLGTDSKRDLVVLKFDAKELPFIELKEVKDIKSGDPVFTIGSPLGLEATITEGIISNPERKEGDLELIQFTAPISSGNSGGGLFNKKGVMIGITTSTLLPPNSRANVQNLNFAVPEKYIEQTMSNTGVELSKNSADYYYCQGVIYNNQKDYAKAEEYFQKAIRLNRRYSNAYTALGELYYGLGRYREEIDLLEPAAKLLPNDPDVYSSLAPAYEDVSEYDRALDTYKKVVELKPDDKDALYWICFLSIITDKQDQIPTYLNKLKTLDPGTATEIEVLLMKIR
jgi:S1-C subfamily serine protease